MTYSAIAEAAVALRIVVYRAGAVDRIFDALAAFEKAAREVIVPVSAAAAVLKTRVDRVEASAVKTDLAAGIERAVLGVHVDDARSVEAVLRRQRARDERDAIEKTRVKFLAETGDAFGDEHIVDAVLQIRVLAADVELAEGILRDAGRSQEGLVEGRVFALRLRLDLAGADGVDRGAEFGRDLVALRIERGGDDNGVERGDGRRNGLGDGVGGGCGLGVRVGTAEKDGGDEEERRFHEISRCKRVANRC